jgi:hypothetical protein
MKPFVKVSGILLGILAYSKGSRKKRESYKVSTRGFLYPPNIYLRVFHTIQHTHSFFIKTKVLIFYSGTVAGIGELAEL